MEFFHQTSIDFMRQRRRAYIFSGALILAGLVSLIAHGGLHYSVDFAGGALVQASFEQPVRVEEVRDALGPAGFGEAEIQLSHDAHTPGKPDFIIRVPQTQEGHDAGLAIGAALKAKFGDSFQVRRVERVGPKVGKELRKNAFWAVLVGLFLLLAYMSWRFEYRAGVAAVAATAHDVIITIGLMSLTNREMSLTALAGLLTVAGYGINDKVVVLDRQRENRRLFHRDPFLQLVNNSLNQTLSRTIITAGGTIMALLCLFFLGGEVLHDFAFILLAGIIIGTYSSIYVASGVLVDWEFRRPRAGVSASAAKVKGRAAGRSRETTGARA